VIFGDKLFGDFSRVNAAILEVKLKLKLKMSSTNMPISPLWKTSWINGTMILFRKY
jgi:hypothetical protein